MADRVGALQARLGELEARRIGVGQPVLDQRGEQGDLRQHILAEAPLVGCPAQPLGLEERLDQVAPPAVVDVSARRTRPTTNETTNACPTTMLATGHPVMRLSVSCSMRMYSPRPMSTSGITT